MKPMTSAKVPANFSTMLNIYIVILIACVTSSVGLQCYQCGQYTDGVGSITPCINYTQDHLKECPPSTKFCIKYVTEASNVRDCVDHCTEKEAWGTYQYCCNEDGCNHSSTYELAWFSIFCCLAVVVASFHRTF